MEKILGAADYTEALDECGFDQTSGFDLISAAGSFAFDDSAAAAEDPEAAMMLMMQFSSAFDELLQAQPLRLQFRNEAGTLVNILQCYYDGYTAMVLAVDTEATEAMLDAVKARIDARAGEPLTQDAAVGFYLTGLLPVLLRQNGVYQPLTELSDASRTKVILDLANDSHESSLLLDQTLTDTLRLAGKYTELADFVPLLETLQTLNAPIAAYSLNSSNYMDYFQLAADKAEDITAELNKLNELVQNFSPLLGE